MITSAKDIFNQDVVVGDIVIFAHKALGLKLGVVSGLFERPRRMDDRRDHRMVRLRLATQPLYGDGSTGEIVALANLTEFSYAALKFHNLEFFVDQKLIQKAYQIRDEIADNEAAEEIGLENL